MDFDVILNSKQHFSTVLEHTFSNSRSYLPYAISPHNWNHGIAHTDPLPFKTFNLFALFQLWSRATAAWSTIVGYFLPLKRVEKFVLSCMEADCDWATCIRWSIVLFLGHKILRNIYALLKLVWVGTQIFPQGTFHSVCHNNFDFKKIQQGLLMGIIPDTVLLISNSFPSERTIVQ